MSKNSYRPGVNQYANQEEARRKARGNPNKNVHQKKKNSNYAGYAGNPVTQKIIEKANQQGEAPYLAEHLAGGAVRRHYRSADPASGGV